MKRWFVQINNAGFGGKSILIIGTRKLVKNGEYMITVDGVDIQFPYPILGITGSEYTTPNGMKITDLTN